MGSRFNPCFPGSSAESHNIVHLDTPPASFNPCFPGSSAESGSLYIRLGRMGVFQSLFSWIKRWKPSPPRRPLSLPHRFNPCFPGSSAESFPETPQPRETGRFNPCFPGSSAESIWIFHDKSLIFMFQSLFSWIKRWKRDVYRRHFFVPKVSILVFLDQALKDWIHITYRR